MQEYMDNGAHLGWLINPKGQQVEIYRQGQEKEVLQAPTSLSGEQVGTTRIRVGLERNPLTLRLKGSS